jgi:propionyl-CoA carboxylase alpha chain
MWIGIRAKRSCGFQRRLRNLRRADRALHGSYRLSQGGTQVGLGNRAQPCRRFELAALMPKKVAADTSRLLLCPMPGLVVSVNVSEGQEVKTGETLAVVEAMKMENVLTAERDGTSRR